MVLLMIFVTIRFVHAALQRQRRAQARDAQIVSKAGLRPACLCATRAHAWQAPAQEAARQHADLCSRSPLQSASADTRVLPSARALLRLRILLMLETAQVRWIMTATVANPAPAPVPTTALQHLAVEVSVAAFAARRTQQATTGSSGSAAPGSSRRSQSCFGSSEGREYRLLLAILLLYIASLAAHALQKERGDAREGVGSSRGH